ncbi:MAG: hypothetical protein HC912_06645 [Saprospiraceae bacterium]|nr:hypothetical protein [Saprospiraceae bacterium]
MENIAIKATTEDAKAIEKGLSYMTERIGPQGLLRLLSIYQSDVVKRNMVDMIVKKK